jgi:hypothetical protein
MTALGRPPGATNDRFVDAKREESGPAVGQLWSGPTGRYGSAAPVRDHGMQPVSPEIVAIVGRHARTTAVAVTHFPWQRRRRSSYKLDRSFAEKTAAGSYGAVLRVRAVAKRSPEARTASRDSHGRSTSYNGHSRYRQSAGPMTAWCQVCQVAYARLPAATGSTRCVGVVRLGLEIGTATDQCRPIGWRATDSSRRSSHRFETQSWQITGRRLSRHVRWH